MGVIRYSGIGSRETPDNVLVVMEKLGAAFAKKGFVLRSGGADGADSAFERGCDSASGQKEIYLPWKGFNGNSSELFNLCDKAFQIAWDFHPNLYGTASGTQKLMARNSYQVLGADCSTKADFVVCYCPLDTKGNWRGGTSQALRIAKHYRIPIFNLTSKEELDALKNFVNQLEAN
jgi:hypothetical protein